MLLEQTAPRTELLSYYAQPGPMTDPRTYASDPRLHTRPDWWKAD